MLVRRVSARDFLCAACTPLYDRPVERLLERDEELRTLVAAFEDALVGRGSVVLVGGEAGSGKSSLVRTLQDYVGERAGFLVGACEPLSVPVPLAPMREIATVAGAPDFALRADDHFALAGSILDAIRGRGAAVVVVEDLHWADPATLDVVRLLVRRVEDAQVLLVLTYRDDELGANRPLAVVVGDLATSRVVRRLRLRPLSDSAIRELAEVARLAWGSETLSASGDSVHQLDPPNRARLTSTRRIWYSRARVKHKYDKYGVSKRAELRKAAVEAYGD